MCHRECLLVNHKKYLFDRTFFHQRWGGGGVGRGGWGRGGGGGWGGGGGGGWWGGGGDVDERYVTLGECTIQRY